MSDFYTESAQTQIDSIDAQMQRALAELAEAKAAGNSYSGADAVQSIADLTVARENILRVHQGYIASQQRPAPIPQTPEEWRVKPADKMTWEDGLEVARNSKYAKNLDFNDPNVQRGYAEVMRRRQRGENQS
jgi:hypothetical protein